MLQKKTKNCVVANVVSFNRLIMLLFPLKYRMLFKFFAILYAILTRYVHLKLANFSYTFALVHCTASCHRLVQPMYCARIGNMTITSDLSKHRQQAAVSNNHFRILRYSSGREEGGEGSGCRVLGRWAGRGHSTATVDGRDHRQWSAANVNNGVSGLALGKRRKLDRRPTESHRRG